MMSELGDWINELAGDYVESWVGEQVAAEWQKDKDHIKELEQQVASREGLELEEYDAGLLGGLESSHKDWWHDYIRAELGRAHEFYQDQLQALLKEVGDE